MVSPEQAPRQTANGHLHVVGPADTPAPLPYNSSLEHVLSELERIDLLIAAQVARARQAQARDELPGLYISEQEVNGLLAQPIGMPRWAALPATDGTDQLQAALARLDRQIQLRKDASQGHSVRLRLPDLAARFLLAAFDVNVVLICLAAELDLRFERLYAYLQDDVTRKRPSVDLVLNLLCASFPEKLEARRRFSTAAPLLQHQLLSLMDDPSNPKAPLLSRYLKLDERVVNYLLGSDEIDARLVNYLSLIEPKRALDSLLLPSDLLNQIGSLIERRCNAGESLDLYFQGQYGVGKRSTAEALCRVAGLKLLVIDGAAVLASLGSDFAATVRLISREAALQGAAIYWSGFDALLSDEHQILRRILLHEFRSVGGMVFLAGETTWEPADAPELRFLRLEFPPPAYADRLLFWGMAMEGMTCDEIDPAALANKFRFTGGQIRDAALTARNQASQRTPQNAAITMADLLEACRLQSNRKLATLATSIKPHFSFDDIVLPPDRLRQLREICKAVEYRSVLYDEWGFNDKLSLGKGLSVLFAGPSGTGKTMAAQILAGELGLDLYKIDLSTVVSKYIGETEKNLSRIFAEAATSNAILFFDEADALFGKRSEVRDSHDRYANIEISYLLQRMEEYEGVVILASNLRKNMDEAFVRRIHATVEFPFPNAEDRLRIWQGVWPEKTPRAHLDLDFLARRFEITGGNIRNIALSAAFLGAEDGGCVQMKHVIRGTWQEYQKMGKVIMEGEFGPYAEYAQTPS
jgi:SpoVK/Ycf46/Vps4 family AAA+-type ATPase